MPLSSVPESHTLLVLCRANLVRSPFAGDVLRTLLADLGRSDLQVRTAGLQAESDLIAPEFALLAAREHGTELSTHHPRPISPTLVAESGLVLTMTESQRNAVERLASAETARTFTLQEFVRLLRNTSDCHNWADLAREAHRQRPILPPAAAQEDIPDPAGHDLRFHRAVAQAIRGSCERIVSLLSVIEGDR